MKRITIKQASSILNVSEQCARMMIQYGQIPGASYHGEGRRKTYFITDEQIKRLMKGEKA